MEFRSPDQDDDDSIEQEIKRRCLDSSYYEEIYTQRITDLLKLVTVDAKYDIFANNRRFRKNHSAIIAVFKRATKCGNYDLARSIISQHIPVRLLISPEKYAYKMFLSFNDLRLLRYLFENRTELFRGMRTSPYGPAIIDNSKWLALAYEVYLHGSIEAQEFFHQVARALPSNVTSRTYNFNTLATPDEILTTFHMVRMEMGRKSPTSRPTIMVDYRDKIMVDYRDPEGSGRTSPCRITSREYRSRAVSSPTVHI
jgi:hypothetical protein